MTITYSTKTKFQNPASLLARVGHASPVGGKGDIDEHFPSPKSQSLTSWWLLSFPPRLFSLALPLPPDLTLRQEYWSYSSYFTLVRNQNCTVRMMDLKDREAWVLDDFLSGFTSTSLLPLEAPFYVTKISIVFVQATCWVVCYSQPNTWIQRLNLTVPQSPNCQAEVIIVSVYYTVL